MNRQILPALSVAGCLALIVTAPLAQACPFCSAVSQTFSEEMASMDVVVIAELVSAAPIPPANQVSQELAKSEFKLVRVLKGEQYAPEDKKLEVVYFGKAEPGARFLVMGADAPQVLWSTPLQLSPRAEAYIEQLPDLPQEHQRLEFFQQYLEDPDEMLARDAYDEFAKTPYAGVIALKEKMDHDQLIRWIEDPNVPASRRRLYLTMLGVCGTDQDADLLEKLIRSENRDDKRGLDALIACYLILKGPQGMDTIEELYLRNKKADYADTYSAIMALRFHGTEIDVIPRPRLVEGLRLMLDRPELADLVIPDLARWEDWDVMPRLVRLFKEATDDTIWVRVPVINFLRACPRPEAKAAIEELAQIDADAVKRASAFFAFGASSGATGKAATRSDQSGEPASDPPPAPAAPSQP